MAKVGTESVLVHDEGRSRGNAESLSFKYSIEVSTKGIFSTMLPEDIVNMFKGANIELYKNRLNRDGYLSDITLDALKSQVIALCKEYLSREKIGQTLIIKYGIKTMAAYCLDIDGEIVPNGNWTRYNGYDWKHGTVDQNATNPKPFGLLVYAQPFVKKIYQYKSGLRKEELMPYYENSSDEKDRPNLNWLSGVCAMSPEGLKIQEIVYTEAVAGVFVNMIKSICGLNERIKDFLEPDAILLMAENNQKLLG